MNNGYLMGVKAERIEMKLAICGGVCCERCASVFDDLEEAWNGLDTYVHPSGAIELLCSHCHGIALALHEHEMEMAK